jgi:hypothetical protein
LVLSGRALLGTASLGLWRDAPKARRSYLGGLMLSGIAFAIAILGLLIGFSFMGGGIIPH